MNKVQPQVPVLLFLLDCFALPRFAKNKERTEWRGRISGKIPADIDNLYGLTDQIEQIDD